MCAKRTESGPLRTERAHSIRNSMNCMNYGFVLVAVARGSTTVQEGKDGVFADEA